MDHSREVTRPNSIDLNSFLHPTWDKTKADSPSQPVPTPLGLQWVCSERPGGVRCEFYTNNPSELTDHLKTSHGEHTAGGGPRLRKVTLESSHMQCLDCGWNSLRDQEWSQHICPAKMRRPDPKKNGVIPDMKAPTAADLPVLNPASITTSVHQRGLTKNQLIFLETKFGENGLYPDKSTKLSACDQIDISERKLNHWLSRRRAIIWKSKLLNLSVDKKGELIEDLSSCHPALLDYDALARTHNLQVGLIKYFYNSNRTPIMLARQGQTAQGHNPVKIEPTVIPTSSDGQSPNSPGNAFLLDLLSKLI